MIVSSMSSGPPLLQSVRNYEHDWILTWSNIRRCLTEYDRNSPRRLQPNTVVVNIIASHDGETEHFEGLCPNWVLQEDSPICLLSDWFQERTFPFSREHSRAFMTQIEMVQNTPTVLVIQELPPDQVPIIVQLLATDLIVHHIYLAFQFERIAAIEDWLQGRARFFRPYDMYLDGEAVYGYQDVRLFPGSVLVLAFDSDLQMQQPQSSTMWTDSVLDVVTHQTWEEELALTCTPEQMPEGNAVEEEHTLEPRRSLWTIQPEHDFTGLLQLEIYQSTKSNKAGDNTATPLGVYTAADAEGSSYAREATARRRAHKAPVEIQKALQLMAADPSHFAPARLPESNKSQSEGLVSFMYLAPPGNPDWWLSSCIDKLDQCIRVGNHMIVVDYPEQESQAVGASEVRALSLNDVLPPGPKPFCKDKIRLSLEQAIFNKPEPSYANIAVPSFASWIDKVFQGRTLPDIDWAEIASDLPTPMQDAFQQLQIGRPAKFGPLEIYTDGSNTPDDKMAAWSVVVLSWVQDQGFLVGLDYGLIETDPMEGAWVGAMQNDSRSAEATALVRACEWVLGQGIEVDQTFCFDAQSAGYAAAGIFQVRDDDRLGRVVRSIAKAVETYFSNTQIKWKHVRAHTNILGNEIADTVAKWAYRMQTSCPVDRPDYTPYVCGRRYAIEFLWMLFQHQGPTTLPQWNDSSLQIPALHSEHGLPGRVPRQLVEPAESSITLKSVKLKVATFNVTTLDPKRGDLIPGYLREQLEWYGIEVLFLQETRTRESQLVQSQTHYRYTSAASQGIGGVETWLLRKHPTTNRLLFEKQHVQVLYATNQILIIKARHAGYDMILINAHAPHTGASGEEISNFWTELVQHMRQWCHGDTYFVIGIDANAHFVDSSEPHIGPEGLEEVGNYGADCFRQLLEEFGCFVPATFPDVHYGENWTWLSPANGSKARCDYVAIPLQPSPNCMKSYVIDNLDIGTKSPDRRPVVLELVLPKVKKVRRSKQNQLDRKKLQAATSDQIASILQDVPAHLWHEDIERHAVSLSEQIATRLATAFPKPRSGPRSGFISEATWELRSRRMALRREIQSLRHSLEVMTTRWTLHWWQGKIRVGAYFELYCCFFRQFGLLRTKQRQSSQEAKSLKKQLRLDKTGFLEELASQAKTMSQSDFHQAMRNAGVRSKKKPGPIQPLPMISDESGTVITDYKLLAERWREYFSMQEDGVPHDPESMLALCDELASRPKPQPAWDDLPTFLQIERQFRMTKKAKAYFVDELPGDVFHIAPSVMATLFYPLYLKEVVFLRECFVHKGGNLVPVYKKGSPAQCSSYRSLFVSSPASKALHAVYRKELIQVFENNRLPLQLGGIPGHSITQAAHVLRLFHRSAARQKRSSAVLFVDISNAFYRLLRRHIVSSHIDERSIKALFADLHLPPEAYAEFQELMRPGPAIEASEVPEYVKHLFQAFYEATWYRIRGTDTLTQSRRGSRPGDTFADMTFGFAMNRILGPVFRTLTEHFPELDVHVATNMDPYDDTGPRQSLGILAPIWADDLAVSFSASSPERVVSLAQEVSGQIFDRLTIAGLTPNLSKGKTELILDCRGPNAVHVRRELSHNDHAISTTSKLLLEPLRIVGSYKHLGSWIETKIGIRKEVRTKFAAAHEVLTRYRAQIFCNRRLPLDRKRLFFESLVLSTIIFNAAIWQAPTQRQATLIQTSFTKLYRRFAVQHFGQKAIKWSTRQVLFETGLHSSETVICVARLRYAGHLVHQGQAHLWALLREERQWWHQVEADIQWLQMYCPEADVPHPRQDWNAWKELVLSSTNSWKSLIRRAAARCRAFESRRYSWEAWHAEIHEDVLQTGGVVPDMPIDQSKQGKQHYCLSCRRCFSTASACSVHAFKAHDRITKARNFVTGTCCEICLKVFACHTDLVNHVNRGQHCMDGYIQKGQRVSREPGVNSRLANQSRADLQEPYMQGEGPLPLPENQAPADTFVTAQSAELQRNWEASIDGRHEARAILDSLRKATCQTCLYHDEIVALFVGWGKKRIEHDEEASLAFVQAFALFPRFATFEWFVGEAQPVTYVHEQAMAFFRHGSEQMHPLTLPRPERVRYRPRMVAHLFSGARRTADVQEFFEAKGFVAISVDIIFNAEWGDLSKPQTFHLFREAIRHGWLIAWIAGPPCETWSRARANEMPNGPRPVRRRGYPWGNHDLTRREDRQVTMGSLLLSIALKLFWTSMVYGATAILEHPADLGDSLNAPSIWRLSVILYFLRFTCCEKVDLLQGHYGGLTPKPTTLLVAHGAEDSSHFLQQLRTTPLPRRAATGKNEDGTWKTAVLKQYPAGLCRALCSLVEAGQSHKSKDGGEIPNEFRDAVADLLQDFNFQAQMGPDFHG